MSEATEKSPVNKSSGAVSADPPDSIGGYMATGLIVVIALVAATGGWAASTQLAGAVLASGFVVVDSNIKKVQHPTGGIVGSIHVRDGNRVQTGDVLIRLDETITRANLAIVSRQLDELAARQARLRAERDDTTDLDLPARLQERMAEPEFAELIQGEQTLFESRSSARAGQRAQLAERIIQLREEIAGLEAQTAAKSSEIALIRTELAGQRELWQKNLIPISKYTHTQREAARIEGERAQLIAAVAQARGKIAEIELQIIQIGQDLRTEVIKELREVQAKEAELSERRVAALDQLKRVEIRAPQDGIVHQLAVHTIGGVIAPGELVLQVVPADDRLLIEAKIAPQDIDLVRPGQAAFIRLTAFDQRTTPEAKATVERVSADISRDPSSNAAYFTARLTVNPGEVERLGNLRLLPGMPADVQIKTADRTALSYLVKPLEDQFAKAFKER